ncbi:excalibur calcium-binding domain-containing protein [Solibacillus sp. FSL W8-0372]|uniref:excalibur calcium-binding domain-containing protein n=1 Tax=Solibacillus sp. FSL W8-0372 TaxID=2921713 RepID=UPI0030D1A8E5
MKKILILLFSIVLIVSITMPTASASTKQLEVHFIDVGQGDSILIQTPKGENILVDGGPRKAGKGLVDYLKKLGIKKLDYVVATHPDADHIGGLVSVLNSISVKNFVNSGKAHTTDTYSQILSLVKNKKIKYIEPEIEQIIIGNWTSDFYMQALFADPLAKDTNDASIVLKVGYKDVEFLLMADASEDLEELLVDSYDSLKVQILKAGHHGSNTSSSKYFLDAVQPEVTILSYGKNNSYKHPHSGVLERLKTAGSKVYSTAENGTIIIKTDGKSYKVSAKEMTLPGKTDTKQPPQSKLETKPVETPKSLYKNCTELNAVYPNGVEVGHKAYELKHDADNDGWACEPVEDSSVSQPYVPPVVTTPTPTPTPTQTSFSNCTELKKVYPNGVSSSHPAYQKKFDRDGDGHACE